MKGTKGVLAWLVLALPVGVAVMSVGGCQRNPLDETPPFRNTDTSVSLRTLYTLYATDEAQADKMYKGKILFLDDAPSPDFPERLPSRFFRLQVDAMGEKYAAVTVPDPSVPSGKREVIRCYIYHPENPVVVGPGSAVESIIGVCVGKVDGVIVLRKCYYSLSGGADW